MDDRPSPAQIAIYQRMSPFDKLRLAEQLRAEAFALRLAVERARHPDWTEATAHDYVKKVFLLAVT